VEFPIICYHLLSSPVPVTSYHSLSAIVGLQHMRGSGEDEGGRRGGFIIQSLSLLMVVVWPCLHELPSEQSRVSILKLSLRNPPNLLHRCVVLNRYLKHNPYPYPANPYLNACMGLQIHDMHYWYLYVIMLLSSMLYIDIIMAFFSLLLKLENLGN
jgi:hypothetical protein